jgi:hypothetical protein
MINVRQKPALIAGATVVALLCLLYLGSTPASQAYIPDFKFPSTSSQPTNPDTTPPAAKNDGKLYGPSYTGTSTPAELNRVTNATLGFQKIFVVSLPERSDKRDALTLASTLTGFNLDWIPGVRGDTIPDKAVPFGVDRKKLMETNLGSWRGHMNAVRRMVEENIETALIMEDDMDWDVRIKPLLETVAKGVRTVSGALPDALYPAGRSTAGIAGPSSPYGDDWDLLWLGHCGEPFPETMQENKGLEEGDEGKLAMSTKYTIHNDATVPPLKGITGLVNFTAYPEHTRWVHPSSAPICTFAYALSQRGARKVLFDLSVDRLSGPFDNALAWLCRRAVASWPKILRGEKLVAEGEEVGTDKGDRGLDMKCFSVTPPVFFHHKAKGKVSGDSDIQVVGGEKKKDGKDAEKKEEKKKEEEVKKEEVREKGKTENIVWSARLNVRNMLMGWEMASQYDSK